MKNCLLKSLVKAQHIESFNSFSQLDKSFLNELENKPAIILRVYSGKSDGSWRFLYEDFQKPSPKSDIAELTDFSGQNPESLLSWHHKDSNKNEQYLFISPYINNGYHLGDLILKIDSDKTLNLKELTEWHFYSDILTNLIFAHYQFAPHLLPVFANDSERLLSFIRETQLILTAKNQVVALTIEQDKQQATEWFKEDQPILSKFISRVQQELNLPGIFILQNAAPGFIHQVIATSNSESKDLTDSIYEMIEAVKQYDEEFNQAIVNEYKLFNSISQTEGQKLVPLVFSCQAGGITFGHLGIFATRQSLARYLNHRSKILPMLANQLGFYFSHLHQLRREALEARMLQQINQTCNTINSSVDIGAILFKLVESLNNLFRQYSGAILMNSPETQELEVTTQLGGPVPENLDIHSELKKHPDIYDLIHEGAVFDNRDGKYPLPIRYILPLSATPQALIISTDLATPASLGAVILYEHPINKNLTEETLQKLLPILLNGISASLQVARNYAEKLETIKSLEGLMSKLSDSDSLFDEMITIIRRLLRVNRISFLTLDESEKYLYIQKEFGLPEGIKETTRIPIGDEISGYVARHGKSLRIDNIEREGLFKKRSMEDYLNRSLLSVPLISKSGGSDKVIGVINVNNKTNGLTFTQQDQQLLEAIAHLVVTALEKVRFLEEKHEKELLERQLKDAKDIQMSLLPKSFNEFPANIEMYGKSIPARQIGGDFFDIIPMDDGRILVALGDVSGKGMPAAILMAVSRMILRSVVQDTSDLTTILDKVNQKLSLELDSYHFVTLQIVTIDPESGNAEMTSAGHGPLMVRLNGKITLIETKGGPPLGISGIPVAFDTRKFVMHPSDCLLMFTDGLSEEHSENGEMFGSQRIEKFLAQSEDLNARETTEKLISEAIKWRGSREAHDDLTLLTLKFKGNIK